MLIKLCPGIPLPDNDIMGLAAFREKTDSFQDDVRNSGGHLTVSLESEYFRDGKGIQGDGMLKICGSGNCMSTPLTWLDVSAASSWFMETYGQ